MPVNGVVGPRNGPPLGEPEERGIVKKTLFVMAALAATAGMGLVGTWVSAQPGTSPTTAAPAKPTLKVGIVNLNMVLKEFKKANVMGESLIKQAQEKETQIKSQEASLQKQVAAAQSIADLTAKDAQLKVLNQQQFTMQEQVIEHRKAFAKMQSDMAVEVYANISQVKIGRASCRERV